MLIERLKEASRPIWQPVVRRLDDLSVRLERVERAITTLESAQWQADWDSGRGESGAVPGDLRQLLTTIHDDVWHSKVVNIGDRLLVGSRHLGMVFLVELGDRLIGPHFVVDGEYEPDTTAFMLNSIKPESVCIDVGANFGYYTCLMARLSWLGRTIAFEPDPVVYELLRDNININWCERVVDPVNAAVGSTAGELTLFRRIGRSGNTSIVHMGSEELDSLGEAGSEEFTVRCVRLDELAADLERVDIVKIDVEGAEALVLDGMSELVRRHKPTVVMEWSPYQSERAGFDVAGLSERIRRLGLQPHTLGPGGATTPLVHDDLVNLTYQNIVLTPS